MLPVVRASSSADADENFVTSRRRQMGAWLSLHQPGTHVPLHCNRRFSSMQAVGGHQNAHKTEIEMEMRQMYIQKMREGEKRKEIQEGKRVECEPFSMITVAPSANGGLDLDLRLGAVPPKKVVEVSGFMAVAKVGGYGSSDLSRSRVNQTHPCMFSGAQGQGMLFREVARENPMPLRIAGVGAGGGGGGWDNFFVRGCVGEPAGAIDSGMTRMFTASKKELDLNLKL